MACLLPFPPWRRILPPRTTVLCSELSREPFELDKVMTETEWSIVCDGSVSEKDEGSWAFTAYQGQSEMWSQSGSISFGKTLMDTEIFTIKEALEWVRWRGCTRWSIRVFSNSKHALGLLQSVIPTQSQNIVQTIRTLMSLLSIRFNTITFQWVKGHIGW